MKRSAIPTLISRCIPDAVQRDNANLQKTIHSTTNLQRYIALEYRLYPSTFRKSAKREKDQPDDFQRSSTCFTAFTISAAADPNTASLRHANTQALSSVGLVMAVADSSPDSS